MSGVDAPGDVLAPGSVVGALVPTGTVGGGSVVVVTWLVVVGGSVVVVTWLVVVSGSVVVVAGSVVVVGGSVVVVTWLVVVDASVVVVAGSVVVVVSGSVEVVGAAVVVVAMLVEMPVIGVGRGRGVRTGCGASVEVGLDVEGGSNVPGWVVDVVVVLVEAVIRASELAGPIRSGLRWSIPSVRLPVNNVITTTPISARTTPLQTATMVDR